MLTDLVGGLDRLGAWRMLFLPDHATPLALRTHTSDPVPYLLADSRDRPRLRAALYTERGVADAPVVAGHELMARLVAPEPTGIPTFWPVKSVPEHAVHQPERIPGAGRWG